MSRISLLTW